MWKSQPKTKGASKKEYEITPIAKPRMTRRDKWLEPPRECVRDYRNFCDACRFYQIYFPIQGAHVTFILPMPESWSIKKKEETDGLPHQSKPDLDNLIKALGDAVFSDDAGIWDIHATKRWGFKGKIIIEEKGD
jgi:hypothetical protein